MAMIVISAAFGLDADLPPSLSLRRRLVMDMSPGRIIVLRKTRRSWGGRDVMSDLLSIDPISFKAAFGRGSTLVHHSFVDHPLFTIEAMAALADELPSGSVGRQRADLEAFEGGRFEDLGGGPPSETIRDIENNRCRVVLRDIQQVPRYARLIDDCLDQVEDPPRRRRGRYA